MKIIRLRDIPIPLPSLKSIKWVIIVAFAGLIVLQETQVTNWQTVYDQMSALDENTIEMGFGIYYSEGSGYYISGGRQIDDTRPVTMNIDPRPILQKMKAAGFYWDGRTFTDQFGNKYSRSGMVQRLFPESSPKGQKASF